MQTSTAVLADEIVTDHPALACETTDVGLTGCSVEVEHYIVPGTEGHGRARADALMAVIGNFVCRVAVFGYDAARGDTFLIMTATRPVLDTLGLLLPAIALRMERAARIALSEYPVNKRERTAFFREYLRGYGIGAAEEIRQLRTQVLASEGPDLASRLADDEIRVNAVFRYGVPGQATMRRERRGHTDARNLGTAAGRVAGTGDDYLAIHDLVFAML